MNGALAGVSGARFPFPLTPALSPDGGEGALREGREGFGVLLIVASTS